MWAKTVKLKEHNSVLVQASKNWMFPGMDEKKYIIFYSKYDVFCDYIVNGEKNRRNMKTKVLAAILLLMSSAAVAQPSYSSYDTIPSRYRNYHYTEWYDECPAYQNGGMIDSCHYEWYFPWSLVGHASIIYRTSRQGQRACCYDRPFRRSYLLIQKPYNG